MIEDPPAVSAGIEIDKNRFAGALRALREHRSVEPKLTHLLYALGDATKLSSLHPFTHVYSFDAAFNPETYQAYVNCVARSPSIRYMLTYRSQQWWDRHGICGITLKDLASVTTHMRGAVSCGSHTARICSIARTGEAGRPDTCLLYTSPSPRD